MIRLKVCLRVWAAVSVVPLFSALAAVRVKANNTTAMNVGSSWVGSAVPNQYDMAQWDSTVTGANTVSLGANMSLRGLTVANPGGNVEIGGANTLTLGGEGLIMRPVAVTADLTLTCSNLTLLLYAGQIWDIASGRAVTVNASAFTRTSGSSIGFLGTVSGTAFSNDATGIMGTWARTGTGTSTRYATASGGAVVPYTAGTPAAIPTDVADTTGAVNYDLAGVGAFGAGTSFHTLRYTGAGGTVSGGFSANGLMNAGSGTLTISGTTTIGASKELVLATPDATRKIAFSGVISDNPEGASGITVAGGGQVDLFSDSTYSGRTVIGAGRVYMNKPNALGSTSGNTVIHVIGSSVTGGILHVAGNITVAEPLTFVGPGDGSPWNSALYSNAGTNSMTGAITLETAGCRLAAGGNGTGLNLYGPITRTSSANTLILGAGGAGGVVNVYGPINNNGGALTTHNGPGLVRLFSQTNNVGTLNVQTYHTVQLQVSQPFITSCALQVGGGNTTSGDQARGIFDMNGFSAIFNDFRGEGAPAEPPTLRVVTNSSPSLSVFTIGNSGGGGTYNGHIDGNLALVKNGTGTSTLCGPNRYTAGTTVNGGVLVLSNAVNHGALAVNGGTFRFPPALTVNGTLSGTGGTIDTLAAGNPLTVSQATNSTFAGAITGAGSLIKGGAGTLTLSGANTYSGGSTVNDGLLVFGRLSAKPASGSVTVAASAGLGLGVGTNTSTYFSTADVDSLWAGTLAGVTLNASSSVGIDTSAGDFTYATSQSGVRGLIKSGNNTLTLSGVNTYEGGTVVRQGVLSIASTSALPGWDTAGAFSVWRDSALAVQNAISDSDIATVLATENFLDGACIGFDTVGSNRTYAEAIANTANGALGVYKLGTNTLTLTAASTYDGNTVVNGGILVVKNSGALGSTNGYTLVNRVGGNLPYYTDSTGQVQLDGSAGALTLDENFILNGAEQYGYSGALRGLSGNITLNGWIKVGAGGTRIGNNSGTLTLTGPITRELASYNPMLVLNPSGTMIVSNRIELGSGGLNFHSGGTVWLCSTGNVWTGYSQIQYGCNLRLGADNALPTGIKQTFGNTGTPPGSGRLDLYGYHQTIGGLIQYGNDASYFNNLIRNTQPGAPSVLTVSQAAGVSDTFSGRIIENVSLVKAGAANSSLTLTGTNSLSGSVTVNGGTLTVGGAGTLGDACTNVVVTAGTLALQNSATIANTATLSLTGGGSAKIDLAAGVDESVRYLFIDGNMQRVGTYGSGTSPASHKDSTLFSGTGVLRVLSDNSGTMILVQ